MAEIKCPRCYGAGSVVIRGVYGISSLMCPVCHGSGRQKSPAEEEKREVSKKLRFKKTITEAVREPYRAVIKADAPNVGDDYQVTVYDDSEPADAQWVYFRISELRAYGQFLIDLADELEG